MAPEIIAGGANILGTAVDAVSSAIQNKKQREWNEKMYERQRKDSLADFTMQNEYNSPTAQMARLREAGLNPNLVYGQGAVANNASGIKASDTKQYNPQRLEVGRGIAGAVGTYYDTKVQQAQYDNLKAQNTVLVNKAAMQGLEAAQAAAKTSWTNTQRENSLRLTDASIKNIEQNILKSQQDIKFSVSESTRRDIMQSQNVKESVERILRSQSSRATDTKQREHIDAQIRQIANNIELSEFEKSLNRLGMTKGDELWQRMIGKLIDEVSGGKTIDEVLSLIMKKIKDGLNPLNW